MTFLSLLFGRLFHFKIPSTKHQAPSTNFLRKILTKVFSLEFGICYLEFSLFVKKNLNFWPGGTS